MAFNRHRIFLLAYLQLCALCAAWSGGADLALVDIVTSSGKIYLSCSATKELRVYDTSGQPSGALSLDTTPGDLVISPDGKRLILCGGPGNGELLVVRTKDLSLERRISCGHSPVSPRFSPDGKMLALAQRFRNEVWLYDAQSLQRTAVFPVGREPIALRWHDDSQIVVAHHLSSAPAVADWTGCTIGLIGITDGRYQEIRLEDGTSGLRDLALTPDGRYALCASVIGSHRVPATQIEQGWINKNGLSVVDLQQGKLLGTLLLDEMALGAANPWGIVLDKTAAWISLSGSHELMRIDYPTLVEALAGMSPAEREDFAYNLRGGLPWKERITLSGSGPRAITMDAQGRILVANYFSSSIERYDPKKELRQEVLPGIEVPLARRGEFLFHDATISFQQWMSCASCHPDGRTDALNWDLENDGVGTPRQAKTMLFAHETPPTTVTGIRPNAETSVRAGILFLRAYLPEEDAVAMDTYLKSLRPVPSPSLINNQLSPEAELGKALFHNKAACVDCHQGAFGTNKRLRYVGSGIGKEKEIRYDVPSLSEIWRTAPYLHDGRATSIHEMLTKYDSKNQHGDTDLLNKEELAQLIEYVKTL